MTFYETDDYDVLVRSLLIKAEKAGYSGITKPKYICNTDLISKNRVGIYNHKKKQIFADSNLYRNNKPEWIKVVEHEFGHHIQNEVMGIKGDCGHCLNYKICEDCKNWLIVMDKVFDKGNYDPDLCKSLTAQMIRQIQGP
jgi:hypothetical protein